MTDLRQAAQAVVERWDTPAWEWRDQGPTADLMADLRTALAQPEFYQPAANEAVEILKSLGYVYEPTYTGLAWVTKKSAQPEQEPVVSLPYHPCTRILIAGLKDLHAWNVLHEWDKERKIVDDGMVATTSPAAQRPWQGLTDEDRRKFAAAQYGWEDLLIAAEAKLKERNHG